MRSSISKADKGVGNERGGTNSFNALDKTDCCKSQNWKQLLQ